MSYLRRGMARLLRSTVESIFPTGKYSSLANAGEPHGDDGMNAPADDSPAPSLSSSPPPKKRKINRPGRDRSFARLGPRHMHDVKLHPGGDRSQRTQNNESQEPSAHKNGKLDSLGTSSIHLNRRRPPCNEGRWDEQPTKDTLKPLLEHTMDRTWKDAKMDGSDEADDDDKMVLTCENLEENGARPGTDASLGSSSDTLSSSAGEGDEASSASDESEDMDARVSWLKLLSGFMQSFGDLSVDAKLCLIARLSQIGADKEAEHFWSLLEREGREVHGNSLSPKKPGDPSQITTFFSGRVELACEEPFAGESPRKRESCQGNKKRKLEENKGKSDTDEDVSGRNSSVSSEDATVSASRSSPDDGSSDSIYGIGSFDSTDSSSDSFFHSTDPSYDSHGEPVLDMKPPN